MNELLNKTILMQENKLRANNGPVNAEDVRTFLIMKFSDLEYEKFFALFFRAKGNLVAIKTITSEEHSSVRINVRAITQAALYYKADACIISHNHPRTSARPSIDDETVTRHFKQLFTLLDIDLLDHIIIHNMTAFSFQREGML